jgi:DNA-binding IclR family transcriptional regulator
MPCIDSSGDLTEMARKILAAMAGPAPLDEISEKTGIPLYRVRSAARELVDAGLAEERDDSYAVSASGHAAILGSTGKA